YSNEFLDCLKVGAVTYGIEKDSMFHARDIQMDLKKTSFKAETPQGEIQIQLNMSGKYNVYNALAAIAAAVNLGIPLEVIANAFRKFQGAPGRFKIVELGQPYTIIIDFAHNFHGLENILKTLILFPRNKIITVFGHGGERDSRVRKKMGEVVGKYSDYGIITADNPRSEDPAAISLEIENGIKEMKNCKYWIILDRVQAIQQALSIAKKEDIVLIAGKGPETEQVYQDHTIYHNDEEVVRKIIKEGSSHVSTE
ncbi:MAG: UDP-N-acetylmuramoyl-L-alanyl-D-glutamate--2,6-diaminopimelate ligase, partial [Candidatus Atribacteria bacterium]|nr:UDP-N-acetylmuramoyl-L-alanyl-D-glutamate--2,6-diaminopimelate ligase [Candidatus Atribacteria bacterium]